MTTATAANNSTWYVATPEGKQEGPISIASVKERLQSGSIQPMQLVWREGMTDWTPAGQVPELAIAPPAPAGGPALVPPVAGPIPAAPNQFASSPVASSPVAPTKLAQQSEAFLSDLGSPAFFRNVGRGCGIAGIVVILGSLAVLIFGYAQFTFGAILCLMWIIGEGTAAILHSLERLGKVVSQQGPDDKK